VADLIDLGPRRFELSNPGKTLFPTEWDDAPVTKADLVDYYRRVGETMLPHLQDRPLVMVRYPDGITGEGFFQKEAPRYFPEWIRRAEMAKQGGTVTHVVCDDLPTLVYLATQACITPHTWLGRTDRPDRPDRLVFDLDPSNNNFDEVRTVALALRDLLEQIDLTPFVQTTGSKGLHVVVPIERGPHIDEVRDLARKVAHQLASDRPDLATVEQRKANRGDRIYIDVMRNAYGQTSVAPYAVRALPGAPVATPLDWHEVTNGRTGPRRYTVHNLFRRLGQRDDPWASLDRHARALTPASRQASS
jgi:bifunctional non-homologous end joining protein LigD